MWCVNVLLVFLTFFVLGQDPTEIVFGGVFDENLESGDHSDLTDQEAFKFAAYLASKENGLRFKAITETNFNHAEDVNIVQSICDYKDTAHVVNKWVYGPAEHRTIINFYPHSSYLTQAYFAILKMSEWKRFTLFYDDNESLLRMGDLLNLAKDDGIVVVLKQLDEVGDGIYRTSLKEAVRSGETNYVIDCNIVVLEEVLRHAQQVGLLTSHYNYFITNLDLQTINLEPFQYSEANITGIRIVDLSNELTYWKSQGIIRGDFNPHFDLSKMKTETALLIDSVIVLAKVISTKISFQNLTTDDDSCDSLKSSRHGYTISNHVKTSKHSEMTGLIEFDGNGFRSNFDLDVITLKDNGINKIGTWNSSKGLITVGHGAKHSIKASNSLRNRTFKVITTLTAPYTMLRETPTQLFGNNRFEGFAIDLIDELGKMEGFNYTFLIREDMKNGAKDPVTGQWSGMIGDVMDGTADLAITDLTITADREEAVDFTSPFMDLGIQILAQKPKNAPPSFFSFADPFALDTWMMLALAYVIVSLSFFIMGRLCQEEWTNPYPCIEQPEFLVNQFSLQNSAWFAVGALMQQGTEIAPIAVSTRMVTGMWWFFVLIMVSSYTANLAAFLATENPIHLFTDVYTLVDNMEKNNMRLGAKANGATESFFKGKNDSVFKKIAKYMKTHPEDMVKENKDGVKLAEDFNNYAFFMESTSISYETQRHCSLQGYGKLLDDKGYGIAMRKNSTYRKTLSMAILKLQTSGVLDDLKRKWWEEKRGGGQCSAVRDNDKTPPLAVQNVQGVFFVTIGGTILAVFLVIAELLISTYKISKKTKIPFKEASSIEMRSFFDFNSDVKPALGDKSKCGSKSSEGTGTSNNNLLAPAPQYGFIPTITKEKL
ncbi:glutamate receptor ionotropic, kainate 2-like isoform X2 [Zophobas morio]|uniref:glutamate receptor ionotropic, kainate 2-like isoform X2 n=1 Tax=Zophobas morio TaxID=2755281 RepID=UPI003082818C